MGTAPGRQLSSWIVVAAAAGVVLVIALVSLLMRQNRSAQAGSVASLAATMRVPLFVDPGEVRHRPRFLFTFDAPEALTDLRTEENLEAVVAGATDDLDLFRRLVAWTRSQFEPGVPDPYPPLDARIVLRNIRSGVTGGFCAQYNYVLVQSLLSLGYPARYVTVVDHEVLEAWQRDRGRWVCLDPLNAATYIDEEDRPLSVLEICDRVRGGRPVIPGPGSLAGTRRVAERAFVRFAVWLRNDHVSRPINFADIDRYKVAYLWAGETPGPWAGLFTTDPADLYFDPEQPPR